METVDKITDVRRGIIDGKEVKYSASATFRNQRIIAIEGHFIDEVTHQKYFGTTPVLTDIITGNNYEIFVSSERFVFSNYSNIKELF